VFFLFFSCAILFLGVPEDWTEKPLYLEQGYASKNQAAGVPPEGVLSPYRVPGFELESKTVS